MKTGKIGKEILARRASPRRASKSSDKCKKYNM
jgi:hypothetical protein